MDNTQRMIRLLGRLRREMNGAVAESMRCYGRDYGLNYGVSIPTIRAIARDEGCDDAFARYLYVQQVRELRLAALHMADASLLSLDDAGFWAAGIINSEVAEEAAFAFLSRAQALPDIFHAWCPVTDDSDKTYTDGADDPDGELLAYAALMAAARARMVRTCPDAGDAAVKALDRYPQSRVVGHGVATLLGGAFDEGDITRRTAARLVAALPEGPAAVYVADEMAWRMEEA